MSASNTIWSDVYHMLFGRFFRHLDGKIQILANPPQLSAPDGQKPLVWSQIWSHPMLWGARYTHWCQLKPWRMNSRLYKRSPPARTRRKINNYRTYPSSVTFRNSDEFPSLQPTTPNERIRV